MFVNRVADKWYEVYANLLPHHHLFISTVFGVILEDERLEVFLLSLDSLLL